MGTAGDGSCTRGRRGIGPNMVWHTGWSWTWSVISGWTRRVISSLQTTFTQVQLFSRNCVPMDSEHVELPRKNRKDIPKSVTEYRLQKGEVRSSYDDSVLS